MSLSALFQVVLNVIFTSTVQIIKTINISNKENGHLISKGQPFTMMTGSYQVNDDVQNLNKFWIIILILINVVKHRDTCVARFKGSPFFFYIVIFITNVDHNLI